MPVIVLAPNTIDAANKIFFIKNALKGAFKSEAAYLKAKKYAKAKMLGYPEKYPFADSTTTIAGHPYYWVASGGIKVVFAPYEVAPYAAGPVTVSIPAAYFR